MRRLAGLLAAVALALAPGAARADAKALAGVWLIEPLYFDVLVDRGVVTPEFPALVIAPDGRFALYRIAIHCDTLGEYERIEIGDQAGIDRACRRAHERSRADLGGSLAILSAAGRWQTPGEGRVQFQIAERGRTPKYYEELIASMRKDIQETAAKLDKSARDEFTRRNMQENRERELQRMANFYTTFFVLEGGPLKFTHDGAFLRLQGERESDTLVYRAVDSRVLEGAAGLVGLLGVSSTRYFRCAVEYLERTQAAELLAIGRDAAAAAAAMLPEDHASWKRLNARLEAHPAMAQMRANGPGAYLGCPARDRM